MPAAPAEHQRDTVTDRNKVAAALRDAAPGTRIKGRIEVGTTASGMEIGIPFVALKGYDTGPCFWINGQVHGGEINGILAAFDFLNGVTPGDLRGNLVVTATANPLALDAREKCAPQDGLDLDQSFPGNPSSFITDRLAAALFAEIRGAAAGLVLNMHTNPAVMDGRPYAVYKQHPNGRVAEADLLAYIAPFLPTVACQMAVAPGVGELPGNVAGGLDYQLLAVGTPAFMIELGGGGRAEHDFIAQGVAGMRAMAQRLGILPGKTAAPETIVRVSRRSHLMVSQGGLFRTARLPGDLVRAGEPFGEVMNVYGDVVEQPILEHDAIAITFRRDPVVHTGDRYAFIAQEWGTVAVAY
ncbi:MAG: succinylglutamate desuccinylase/aspartoacylase family protein [Alphaproteobacteria bacterium]|nr:succinylglutamate desuccinylase/aspartoacylase family protein [Alphaproteobacteria bacterium]